LKERNKLQEKNKPVGACSMEALEMKKLFVFVVALGLFVLAGCSSETTSEQDFIYESHFLEKNSGPDVSKGILINFDLSPLDTTKGKLNMLMIKAGKTDYFIMLGYSNYAPLHIKEVDFLIDGKTQSMIIGEVSLSTRPFETYETTQPEVRNKKEFDSLMSIIKRLSKAKKAYIRLVGERHTELFEFTPETLYFVKRTYKTPVIFDKK
jgi:hypothetical protein